jgi:signal recognition particle subunit SRP54
MGDIVSLVEKAQSVVDEKAAIRMQEKMAKNTFDLQDYLDQLNSMDKMGSIDQLLEMIPGAKGQVSEDDVNTEEIRREKAIILSMTYAERSNYHIMGPTRRKRVAKGSGTTVSDVNRLLKKFEKMRLTMKKLAKNKKYQAEMLKQMGM